jgi:hypothetical protein
MKTRGRQKTALADILLTHLRVPGRPALVVARVAKTIEGREDDSGRCRGASRMRLTRVRGPFGIFAGTAKLRMLRAVCELF